MSPRSARPPSAGALEPPGVVVIGAGDMGERHARWWADTGARIVAVVDPDGARARAVAAAYGGQALEEAGPALERDDASVVSVCVPTHLHVGLTVAALHGGKHVLCEKPVALRLADAEAMRVAERASGRHLRIGFMRRFDPAWDTLLAFGRRIGGPVLAQATVTAGVRPKRLMHDADVNGGPLIDMACHLFDQWEALFGEPPSTVRAFGYTFGEDKPELADIRRKAVDSALVTLRYPGGGVGQLQISWGLPAGVEATERHSYLGPDGLVTATWPERVELQRGGETLRWTPPPADPWREEIANFRRELAGREHRPLADVDAGIRALRTSLAALTSIAEDREVAPAAIEPETA